MWYFTSSDYVDIEGERCRVIQDAIEEVPSSFLENELLKVRYVSSNEIGEIGDYITDEGKIIIPEVEDEEVVDDGETNE